jgi:Leucine-rich repeat (LRR) protein
LEDNFPNLKWLNVCDNKLGDFPAIKLPKLEYLDISGNKIEKVNEGWSGHANIKILKSVDNKFKTFAPFKNMPKLEELYVATNAFTSLAGWEGLDSLKRLHARNNKIDKVEEELVVNLPALEYLNLRKNKIPSIDIVIRLFQFPNLKDINLIKNPVEQQSTSFNVLMADVLMSNTRLDRFCQIKVEEKHKLEAVMLKQYRWEQSEIKRKEDERLAAEKDAADAAAE